MIKKQQGLIRLIVTSILLITAGTQSVLLPDGTPRRPPSAPRKPKPRGARRALFRSPAAGTPTRIPESSPAPTPAASPYNLLDEENLSLRPALSGRMSRDGKRNLSTPLNYDTQLEDNPGATGATNTELVNDTLADSRQTPVAAPAPIVHVTHGLTQPVAQATTPLATEEQVELPAETVPVSKRRLIPSVIKLGELFRSLPASTHTAALTSRSLEGLVSVTLNNMLPVNGPEGRVSLIIAATMIEPKHNELAIALCELLIESELQPDAPLHEQFAVVWNVLRGAERALDRALRLELASGAYMAAFVCDKLLKKYLPLFEPEITTGRLAPITTENSEALEELIEVVHAVLADTERSASMIMSPLCRDTGLYDNNI